MASSKSSSDGLGLVVAGVSKRFGGVQATSDVSVSIGPGEIVSIIGPNGAGKTSLLNIISGFYVPDTGCISIDGIDITAIRPSRIASLGIARTFQNIALFSGLTVLENVMLGRHVHMSCGLLSNALFWGAAHKEEQTHRMRAEEIMKSLGLTHLRTKMTGELAYGLRKRVELARAMALQPRVLLLDEPMGGMNQDEKQEMAYHIKEINAQQGTAIVLIEHDIGIVMEISQRVIVIERGKKIAEGTPSEVQSDPLVIQAYLGTRRTAKPTNDNAINQLI